LEDSRTAAPARGRDEASAGGGLPEPGESANPLARLRGIAERVARSRGLEIFDVQMRRESGGTVLRIVIDRPAPPPAPAGQAVEEQSIGIEDCRRVSEEIGTILDVEDFIDRAYTLEVSSPGLDRPLRHAAEYARFTGKLAKVVLSEPVDGQKHFRGRLRGLEEDVVLIEDDRGGLHRVPLSVVSRARLEVEF
jgi:ribosome maturation factor RimP